jgi:hypothetical protein
VRRPRDSALLLHRSFPPQALQLRRLPRRRRLRRARVGGRRGAQGVALCCKGGGVGSQLLQRIALLGLERSGSGLRLPYVTGAYA